jgi:pimeloyl-ACP methyl ester carboxylesterase
LSVNQENPQFLDIGSGSSTRRIAFRRRAPAGSTLAGLVWLGGFKSDMDSTKASALDAHCAQQGRAYLRFDYSGHGLSGGDFEEGTISRWLEESLAVFRSQTEGPQILVGSSMGGYIALLLARELANSGQADRIAGMALIAPAVDFPVALLWERANEDARRDILEKGAWRRPSEYSDEPYVFTRALIEDGRRHLLLGGIIRSYSPTRILQGMKDDDVPYAHALKLIEHMPADPVTLTLVRDGDHRLSRPSDIALLFEAVDSVAGATTG